MPGTASWQEVLSVMWLLGVGNGSVSLEYDNAMLNVISIWNSMSVSACVCVRMRLVAQVKDWRLTFTYAVFRHMHVTSCMETCRSTISVELLITGLNSRYAKYLANMCAS